MIKHLLYLTACVLFTMNLNAQTIPNASFETWNPGPGYEDPDQWSTLNVYSTQGMPITVTKALNAQSGSFGMQLESKAVSTTTIAATAWLGGANGRGVPFTQRPGVMNIYTQYYPSGTDTAHVYLEFWKNNGSGSVIVGDAMVRLTSNITTYTQSSSTINWYGTTAPDSVRLVIIASSIYTPQAGTILLVDNITFTGAAGINDLANDVAVSVYPNPASDAVRFSAPVGISTIEVYDLSGRIVDAHEVNAKETMISTIALTTGIYMFTVKDANNTVINRGKLSIAK